MRRQTSIPDLITGILNGNRLALSRAISHVEDEQISTRSLLQGIYRHTGRAHLIGVTGAPGTGKSTLVTQLARSYRQQGQSVAVLAVDPTSPFTGGALLGDRVRMNQLSGDAGVFIRSMATRGHLGGVAAATADVLLLLDAAGFERIIVETVGVGQAEVEIASMAHTTVVVEAPGLGDEVQAIKAGVLEIADIFVVNKADRPGTERTISALEMMLEQKHGGERTLRHHGQVMIVTLPDPVPETNSWQIPVLKSVATAGEGISTLHDAIEKHHTWLHNSGMLAIREEARIVHTLEALIHTELNRRLRIAVPATMVATLVTAVRKRTIDPHEAAARMIETISNSNI
jgi:LAO/AO transport system kinase